MPPRLADLSADLDALYRAPLVEFIERRNALVTRVRGEQGKESAAAIKAMVKPSGTAWVVNQLFWRDARDFDKLMKAGDRLRDVQQARLAGDDEADMRGAMEARQAALAALMARVPDLLGEAGLSASQAMRQRVSTTLEALSIYGGREPGPRVGRLTEDVDPPGFSALAALVPPSAGPFSFAAAAAAAQEEPADERSARAGAKGSAKSAGRSGAAGAARAARESTEATPAPAPTPRPRPVDMRRVAEAKTALERADEESTEAAATAKTADAVRQKMEAAWQRAKEALDEAQRALDAAMEREREAEEARDAARKTATATRQAADRAERTRDQAERAYQAVLGR